MKLFIFGLGYVGKAIALKALEKGCSVSGTVRSEEKAEKVSELGIKPVLFDDIDKVGDLIRGSTHLLSTIPPSTEEPVLRKYRDNILDSALTWVGYISSTSVYGNYNGEWVDEKSILKSTSKHGVQRIRAENEWKFLYERNQIPVQIFRLSGVYGPDRNLIQRIKKGQIVRKQIDTIFGRIHIEDVAQVILHSMQMNMPGGIFNVSDDLPVSINEVIEYICAEFNLVLPHEEPYDPKELTPLARSFYEESKRVRNHKMKKKLKVKLLYPDYKAGLQALKK